MKSYRTTRSDAKEFAKAMQTDKTPHVNNIRAIHFDGLVRRSIKFDGTSQITYPASKVR
jgi:hypothetical protein